MDAKYSDMSRAYNRTAAGTNNYDIAVERTRPLFLKCDQSEMIEKFHLRHDADYLYLNFAGQEYRTNRHDGIIERTSNCQTAGFNEAMTIYDVLGYSRKDCRLSGSFITLAGLKFNAAFGSADTFFRNFASYFDHRIPAFDNACERLGGIRKNVGDTSWRLPLFDFLPVIIQFWESDEDFPASLKILWDANILDFMHFETTFYAANHLLGRIRTEIAKQL